MSVLSVMWLMLTAFAGIMIGLAKSFIHKILLKFDVLIHEIQELKSHTLSHTKDIERIEGKLKEHTEEIKELKNKI